MLTSLLALSVLGLPVVQGSKVELRPSANGMTLYRNGQPYWIKGAGCSSSDDVNLKRLADAGGNSIRTWGTGDDTPGLLDRAHKNGLTVTVGYWLGHVAHGFKWNDQKQLDDQFEKVRETVRKYKNHPAVLMWALGNEMESGGNDNPTLWKEIGRLAKMVKEEDPNHPVTTVVAEVSAEKAKMIAQYAPDVQLLGVNSYGGLSTLTKRLKEFGWKKPFMVTEFGPLGQWEVAKTDWQVALEPTSTQKAELYKKNYEEQIKANPSWCLGSYAFIWGFKQEETATWFGMQLPTGEALQSAEEMQKQWSGKAPKNLAPRIETPALLPSMKAKIGEKLTFSVPSMDLDGDTLEYEFVVMLESKDKKPGGYPQTAPPTISTVKQKASKYIFTVPPYVGEYRVYAFVRDGKGNAATANLPFLVQ